jgi:spore maturation protein CgeB
MKRRQCDNMGNLPKRKVNRKVLLSAHPDFRHKQPQWQDLRVLFIGGYWMGDNDLVKMMLHSLEDLGPQVREYSTEEHRDALDCGDRAYDYGRWGPVYLKPDHLRTVIDEHDPHLIVCCAGGLTFPPDMAAQLRERHCLAGIVLSDPDLFEPATSKICRNFDVFFTNSLKAVDLYDQIGVKSWWLPYACYPKYLRRLPPQPRYECDVLLIGEVRPNRVPLARNISARFRTRVFGRGWDEFGIPNEGMLSSDEVVPAINSASVCVDFPRNFAGDCNVKYRAFEVAGCGSVLCTEKFEEIGHHFRFGEEILGYDTEIEMLHQISQCIADPVYRQSIADAAYARTRAEHTFAHRWHSIVERCGFRMSGQADKATVV